MCTPRGCTGRSPPRTKWPIARVDSTTRRLEARRIDPCQMGERTATGRAYTRSQESKGIGLVPAAPVETIPPFRQQVESTLDIPCGWPTLREVLQARSRIA